MLRQIEAQRADLTDRNGRILATNILTHSLYAQPKDMVDPARVARELAAIDGERPAGQEIVLHVHHHLVGLHGVADLLEPAGDLAFLHGQAPLGHDCIVCHQ